MEQEKAKKAEEKVKTDAFKKELRKGNQAGFSEQFPILIYMHVPPTRPSRAPPGPREAEWADCKGRLDRRQIAQHVPWLCPFSAVVGFVCQGQSYFLIISRDILSTHPS